MSDLVVTENITLDGVIEAVDGWFSPAADDPVDRSDLEETLREHMAASDALLLGRVTFEQMRDYWPRQTSDTSGIRDHLNAVAKYVVSSTVRDPRWENTAVLRDLDEVAALKSSPGKDIVATGSMQLAGSLIDAGLVDEYRLFVYPVVLGRGHRLFEASHMLALRLVETRAFRSGVVLQRYRSA